MFFYPSKKEIEEFDVASYWAKLEQKYFGKIQPTINRLETNDDESSPPLSPVISQTFDVSRLKENVTNHKTSTPMTLVEKIATVKRNCANARRALQMIEDEEKDSDRQNNKKKELDRSRLTNSQFKDDSSFMEAVMASSFGENSDNKNAKNQTKQNTSKFQVL